MGTLVSAQAPTEELIVKWMIVISAILMPFAWKEHADVELGIKAMGSSVQRLKSVATAVRMQHVLGMNVSANRDLLEMENTVKRMTAKDVHPIHIASGEFAFVYQVTTLMVIIALQEQCMHLRWLIT